MHNRWPKHGARIDARHLSPSQDHQTKRKKTQAAHVTLVNLGGLAEIGKSPRQITPLSRRMQTSSINIRVSDGMISEDERQQVRETFLFFFFKLAQGEKK